MAITINTRRTSSSKKREQPSGSAVPAPRKGDASEFFGPSQPGTGEPLRELPEVRSTGGVLEYTLRSAPTEPAAADGATGRAETAGAILPSEILRVRPADRVRLRRDDAAKPTGDKAKSAGDSQQHTYEVPADCPAGLHWSHPRLHGGISHRAWQGQAGPVIVQGDIDKVAGIAGARERTLVLGAPISKAGGSALAVNGQRVPDIDIQPGEIQRWRILNAEPHRSIWLHVEGHTLHQIGQDGMPFAQARPARSIMLNPGNRAELLIRATTPGQYRVYAEGYNQGHPGGAHAATDLATMAVDGRPVFTRMPRRLVQPPQLPTAPVAKKRTVHFSGDINGRDSRATRIVVDGKQIDAGRLGKQASAGVVEEWTLVNDDAFQRPVHLDLNPFQVIGVQGVPATDPSWQTDPEIWWDTYRLPANGQITVRVYFTPPAA